jgi:hypothetical protein
MLFIFYLLKLYFDFIVNYLSKSGGNYTKYGFGIRYRSYACIVNSSKFCLKCLKSC